MATRNEALKAQARARLAKNRARKSPAAKAPATARAPAAEKTQAAAMKAAKQAAAKQAAKQAAKKTRPARLSRPEPGDVGAILKKAQAKQRIETNAARKDLAEVKRLMTRIRRDFYDVGVLLRRLKDPARYRALGCSSFGELVDREIGMSIGVANRLVGIAENVSRELAEEIGQSHAWALVRLAMATPQDDTADELSTKTLALPTGERLHVPTASVRAKNAAAAVLRQASGKSRRGSNTSSPEERAMAKEIEASLRALGVKKAQVRAQPTKPGAPAELRVWGVPMSSLDLLCQAICPG